MGSDEQRPVVEDAARAIDHEEHREIMTPGDQAPPGDPGAGENTCRVCNGSGETDGKECASCGGTGKVSEAISGGA